MADDRQHVLIIGAKQTGLERVAPMLRRADFSVHTVDPSPYLHDLVLSTEFELVVVAYPLENLAIDDLLDAIRNDGSACRDAGLLLLSDPAVLEEANTHVNTGANRAICTDWNDGRLWQAIGDLLEIAPRIFMRVLFHADFEITSAPDQAIFQTVNISKSGTLLQGHKALPPGSPFDFLFRLPGGGLVEGNAEVVRQANSHREGLDGVGTRFLDFSEGGRDRLLAHIDRQITLGNIR